MDTHKDRGSGTDTLCYNPRSYRCPRQEREILTFIVLTRVPHPNSTPGAPKVLDEIVRIHTKTSGYEFYKVDLYSFLLFYICFEFQIHFPDRKLVDARSWAAYSVQFIPHTA